MALVSLRSGVISARISTEGGCVLRLDHGEIPLLRPASDTAGPLESGCFPLVPFGNRVRDNRFRFDGEDFTLRPNTDWDLHYLHGEGWRSEWEVAASSNDAVTMIHRHDGAALPYSYQAEQRIALLPNGAVLELSVTNLGERAMPFGIGWHPYFPLTPETTLQTGTGRMWTEEAGWLPGRPVDLPEEMDFSMPRGLPNHWVNNGFEDWSGQARIEWPEHGAALRIEADSLFRSVFLFVSDVSFDPGYTRDFFALEPMSHLADGHNHADLGGLVALAPGARLSGAIRLTAEIL